MSAEATVPTTDVLIERLAALAYPDAVQEAARGYLNGYAPLDTVYAAYRTTIEAILKHVKPPASGESNAEAAVAAATADAPDWLAQRMGHCLLALGDLRPLGIAAPMADLDRLRSILKSYGVTRDDGITFMLDRLSFWPRSDSGFDLFTALLLLNGDEGLARTVTDLMRLIAAQPPTGAPGVSLDRHNMLIMRLLSAIDHQPATRRRRQSAGRHPRSVARRSDPHTRPRCAQPTAAGLRPPRLHCTAGRWWQGDAQRQ